MSGTVKGSPSGHIILCLTKADGPYKFRRGIRAPSQTVHPSLKKSKNRDFRIVQTDSPVQFVKALI